MARKSFETLWDQAVARKGVEALEARLPTPATPEALAATPDDRWLALMTKRTFQAGFVWKVVENKWEGFEAVFNGFDPAWMASLGPIELDEISADTRIVRNLQKIKAAADNARFVREVSEAHGSFGRWVTDWPGDRIVELWWALKKRGARLGGTTGPMVLRGMGKDTFMLTRDVVASLVAQGVVDKAPTSKTAQRACQEAFNAWRAESGRPLGHISIVLACGIDA